MAKLNTFLDAGIFLLAYNGDSAKASPALALFEDTNREFICSELVKLEVLPQAAYHKQQQELDFYRTCFDLVRTWISINPALIAQAHALAARYGLHGMDALHVAAALEGNATEFITTEGPNIPLYRVTELKVVRLGF